VSESFPFRDEIGAGTNFVRDHRVFCGMMATMKPFDAMISAMAKALPFLWAAFFAADAVAQAGQEGRILTLPEAAPSLTLRIDPGFEVARPSIRIGLTGGDRAMIEVGAQGGGARGFRILDGDSGVQIGADRRDGLRVVRAGGEAGRRQAFYQIQAGAFRDRDKALETSLRLEREFELPARIVWQPDRLVWRVRLGEEEDRQSLSEALLGVRAFGYPDAWITRQNKTKVEGGALALIDADWNVEKTESRALVFVPLGGARVTVADRPYRGLIEIRIEDTGDLLAINEVHLEEYLLGVVPAELGPAQFPEIEALKAQTIAARTYALGNLGQFAERGFDVCDTPRCQAYHGARVEHALSSRAVRETAGEILVYDGRPIMALYTSTAGGATEDVHTVFPEWRYPYLQGVLSGPSVADATAALKTVEGRVPPESPDHLSALGEPTPLDLALLRAHGIVADEALDPVWRRVSLGAEELVGWITALNQAAGIPAPPVFEGSPRRIALWEWWDRALGPAARGVGLVAEGDGSFLLQVVDRVELDSTQRELLARLIVAGIVRPPFDGRIRPERTPTRAEALGWVSRAAGVYDVLSRRRGVYRGSGAEAESVTLEVGRKTMTFTVDQQTALLAQNGGGWSPVSRVEMMLGDEVIFVDDGRGRLSLLALKQRRGRADDRSGSRFRWTRNRSRAELEAGVNAEVQVGRLLDLRVLARGVSGRVERLEVIGTKGKAEIHGFRMRRVLGLPETLFWLDVQHEEDGTIRRVVFHGRGWGHGVGLCQIGAFGMARRGAEYRRILSHYYQGATLVRVSRDDLTLGREGP